MSLYALSSQCRRLASLWEFKTLDPNGKFRQCWDVGGILLLLKAGVYELGFRALGSEVQGFRVQGV